MNNDSPRSARRAISATFSALPGVAAVAGAESITTWISLRISPNSSIDKPTAS